MIVAECAIGKLLDSGIDLQKLSREKKCILTTNPSLDPSSYPRTRPYVSGSFHFASSNQTGWGNIHGCTIAGMQMVSFVERVHFLDPTKLVVNQLVSLCINHLTPGPRKLMQWILILGQNIMLISCKNELVKRYENPLQTITTQLNAQVQKTM